jgi:FecR protein
LTDDNPPGKAHPSITPPHVTRLVELAADLVLSNEVLLGPSAIPDFDALRARYRRGRRRGRLMFAAISASAAAALGTVTVISLSRRPDTAPISYVVEGPSTVKGNAIEAPPLVVGGSTRSQAETRVRFAEGTSIALEPGARLRIPARTTVGAQLALDRGRASFVVAHRPGALWRVMAGPFVVEVIGTRFGLDWSSTAERLTLELEAGAVVVHGDVAGPGIAVRSGERLVASVRDGRVTVASMNDVGVVATTSARSTRGGPPPDALPFPLRAKRRPATERSVATGSTSARERNGRTAFELPEVPRSIEPRLDLQPAPIVSPILAPSAPSLLMGGGGPFCTADRADLGFEEAAVGGFSVPTFYHLALSSPRPDSTHSWCGVGSVRLDVNFDQLGRRNFMGRLPHQSGEAVIQLPQLTDFTDKTVSMHVFIDGPPEARIAAQLFVIHHGKWVNGPIVDQMVPKRWWTISHRFQAQNPITVGPPYPPAGTSLVTECDRMALIVYSTGGPRTWTGAIYVDDVGWN